MYIRNTYLQYCSTFGQGLTSQGIQLLYSLLPIATVCHTLQQYLHNDLVVNFDETNFLLTVSSLNYEDLRQRSDLWYGYSHKCNSSYYFKICGVIEVFDYRQSEKAAFILKRSKINFSALFKKKKVIKSKQSNNYWVYERKLICLIILFTIVDCTNFNYMCKFETLISRYIFNFSQILQAYKNNNM